jgi:hypothetical protein
MVALAALWWSGSAVAGLVEVIPARLRRRVVRLLVAPAVAGW